MDKRALSERDICTKFIALAVKWELLTQDTAYDAELARSATTRIFLWS